MSKQLRQHVTGPKLEICSLEIHNDNPVQEFLQGLANLSRLRFETLAKRLCANPEAYLSNEDYWKPLLPYCGIHEIRDIPGGLRYYGFREGDKLIILCAAGHKDDQSKDFRRAKSRMEHYRVLRAEGHIFSKIEEKK